MKTIWWIRTLTQCMQMPDLISQDSLLIKVIVEGSVDRGDLLLQLRQGGSVRGDALLQALEHLLPLGQVSLLRVDHNTEVAEGIIQGMEVIDCSHRSR